VRRVHAEDAAELAPSARASEMAPGARQAGPSTALARDRAARASARRGELALGPSPDLRGAREARPAGIADEYPPAACASPAASRAEAVGPELARVPPGASAERRRGGLLTVESAFLCRYYALFLIGHGTRRFHLAGRTTNPSGSWVTQQARNLGLFFAEQQIRVVIREGVAKYSGPFDEVLRARALSRRAGEGAALRCVGEA
jgi:hypothetical protein